MVSRHVSILVLSLLLWLALPGFAQQGSPELSTQEQAEIQTVLESFTIRLVRLVVATAYSDPDLTVQELDGIQPDLLHLEAFMKRFPDQAEAFDEIHNIFELVRLSTMAEFGLTDDYEKRVLPLVAESERTQHKLTALVTGFRTALDQGRYEQAGRFLRLIRETVAEDPESLNPINRYIVASLPMLQRVKSGEQVSQEELTQTFRQAWSLTEGYAPGQDLSEDVVWYQGRYVTKFWFRQFLNSGDSGEETLRPAAEQLGAWATDFEPEFQEDPENPFKQVDQLQGAISYLTSTIDIILFPYEENPELLSRPAAKDFHSKVAEFFGIIDQVSTVLSTALAAPDFPPYDLRSTSYLESLKLRADIIFGLDRRQALVERREKLVSLPARAERLSIPRLYISTHLRLGQAFLSVEQPKQAVGAWEKALERAQQFGFDHLTIRAATFLAEEYGRRGEWDKAASYRAVATQSLGQRVGSLGVKEMTRETRRFSDEEASAYLQSAKPEQALEALNRGHQLGTAAVRVNSDPKAQTALRLLARKKSTLVSLRGKVSRLQKLPESKTRDQLLEGAESLLADSRAEFLLESRKLRAKFPNLYSSTLRFDPLNLAEIQGTLPEETAVVQYFPTDEKLYIFVVTRDSFRLRSVAVTRAELNRLSLGLLAAIRKLSPSEKELARELYRVLILPVQEDIASFEQLVLIPSGRLNVVPFAALLGERRLVEEKKLVELAKTTDFLKIAAGKPEPLRGVVAFANATLDLPGTEREGELVRSLFPDSKLFQRTEANKANLVEFGTKSDILHLATHGFWDSSDSLKNYLRLSNDERLAQEDIFGLDLSGTSVVTLSACNTAIGDNQDHEMAYVSSLAEAFWIAGSHSVVASLWAVDDTSTSLLMEEFYRGLKSGASRGEALRSAQQKVMAQPKYEHPYYWSGFLLFGDYR